MFDIKMRVVDVDAKIIRDLRQSGLSAKMKSLELSKFLVIEEDKEKIIGAAGISGFFNIQLLQVLDEYQGKGIGKKLFVKLVEEEKRRGYSYSLGSRNPQNIPMVKLGDLTNRYVLFRIHYTQGITRDVNILVLRKRGKIVAKFLRLDKLIVSARLIHPSPVHDIDAVGVTNRAHPVCHNDTSDFASLEAPTNDGLRPIVQRARCFVH